MLQLERHLHCTLFNFVNVSELTPTHPQRRVERASRQQLLPGERLRPEDAPARIHLLQVWTGTGLHRVTAKKCKFHSNHIYSATSKLEIFQGIFMYIDNREDYGHLVSADNFDTSHTNNELYQILENKYDFESRYLHPDYQTYLEENRTLHEVEIQQLLCSSLKL